MAIYNYERCIDDRSPKKQYSFNKVRATGRGEEVMFCFVFFNDLLQEERKMSHIRKAIKPGPTDYEHNDVKLLLKRNEKATIGNSPRKTDFTKGKPAAPLTVISLE